MAQLIVGKIANTYQMDVDDLGITERGKMGFRSSDLSPKRSTIAKAAVFEISFLHAEKKRNEFFSAADIGYHPGS